jgi:hypothetical protein
MMPAAEPPASSSLAKVLSGLRRVLPPFCWEGGDEGLSPLRGGMLAREGFSPSREKLAYERRLETCPEGQDLRARGRRILPRSLCQPQERTWGTRGGSPLWRTCRRYHYHGRRGNDGRDRLVKSHWRSAPDGARGKLGA